MRGETTPSFPTTALPGGWGIATQCRPRVSTVEQHNVVSNSALMLMLPAPSPQHWIRSLGSYFPKNGLLHQGQSPSVPAPSSLLQHVYEVFIHSSSSSLVLQNDASFPDFAASWPLFFSVMVLLSLTLPFSLPSACLPVKIRFHLLWNWSPLADCAGFSGLPPISVPPCRCLHLG